MRRKTIVLELKDSNPELLEEWDYELNNKENIFIDKPVPRSYKIHWICKNNHRWVDTLSHRILRKSRCPICQNKTVAKGINDFATFYPELAAEADNDFNDIRPDEVTVGSTKKIWWKCPNGHEHYKASFYSRAHGSGCPICNSIFQTSFPEQAILFYIKKLFPDVKNKYKDLFKGAMELDIFIPSLNVGIEYDGKAWHNNEASFKREQKKFEICKKNGIFLYRFKEQETDNLYANKAYFVGKFHYLHFLNLNEPIKSLLGDLSPNNDVQVDVESDRFEILKYKIIKYENSLACLYPEIASEWHPYKNGTLTPEKMIPGSSFRVWWRCNECGNEWQSTVSNRVQGHGCDKCAMIQRKITYHQTRLETRELLIGHKCLLDWDYSKNEHGPEYYTKGSGEEIWWKCHVCGHEWRTPICDRTRDYKNGCPACSNRILVKGKNDLATTNPELIEQWHPTLNGDLTPSDVAQWSHQKVWWLCNKCGYEYQATVGNKVLGKGCGCCSGRVVVPGKNDLATTNPELAIDWHPTFNGELTPKDVTKGQKTMIWWKCHICGFEWKDSLNHRSRGRGCRICNKKKKTNI